jgi:hypothetical protein
MMEANVTIGSTTHPMSFILIHGKAQNSSTAYDRRKKAAGMLKDYLNANKPNERFIILGDYNDDLDITIATPGQATDYPLSSYSIMISDSAKYKSITLPLSLAGLKSTVAYSDVIDHMVISNELGFEYNTGTASILKAQVESWVTNYGSSTSDHYPVMARFSYLNQALPLKFLFIKAEPTINGNKVVWETTEETAVKQYSVLKSIDGVQWDEVTKVKPKYHATSQYEVIDQTNRQTTYYKVKSQLFDAQNPVFSKLVSVEYLPEKGSTLFPNPTNGMFYIERKDLLPYDIFIINSGGAVVKQIKSQAGSTHTDISELPIGIYQIILKTSIDTKISKIVLVR